MATFDGNNLSLGAGKVYVAPLGTTEPTDLATALPAAWVPVGYTSEGSEFSYEYQTDPVEVAESLEPIKYTTTMRSGSVAFAMAEVTATNLKTAFNGGTVSALTGTAPNQFYTFEPPAIGSEVRLMVVFESEDKQERWLFRQCFQGGTVNVARRKGADKASLPVSLRIEKPATGSLAPFKVFLKDSRLGG